MTRSVWATGFAAPQPRADAAPTRRGKPCGASHISRDFRCHAGSGTSPALGKAGAAALGAGFIATGLVVATNTRPWTRNDTRALREAVAAGTWKLYDRKLAADRRDPEAVAIRSSCRIDGLVDCRHQLGEPSKFGRVYLHPENGLLYKTPRDRASIPNFIKEFESQTIAHASGAQVPRPVTHKPATGAFAMEYAPGAVTLREFSNTQAASATVQDRRKLSSSLFESARKLHRAGITHNDAHPGNFLVLPDRSISMIDFGRSVIYRRDKHDYFALSLDRDLSWMIERIGQAEGLSTPQVDDIKYWMRYTNKPFLQHLFRVNGNRAQLAPLEIVQGVDAWYTNLNKALNYTRSLQGRLTRATML